MPKTPIIETESEYVAEPVKTNSRGRGGLSSNHPTMTASEYLSMMDEKSFQAAVVDLARLFGWLHLHIPNAMMNPILPDLILIREGVVLWRELKTERGKLGPKQEVIPCS